MSSEKKPYRLPYSLKEAIRNNPHIKQLDSKSWKRYIDASLHPLEYLPRTIDETGSMKYHRRPLHERSTLHWGQLKLLYMEIEFLTNFAKPSQEWSIVYAGAAPGNHILYLSKLFPNCKFILYDPAEFCDSISTSTSIVVINGFFTEKVAEYYSKRNNILFISDIRTCKTPSSTDDDLTKSEEDIQNDMSRQYEWVKTIKPYASMLKLRFPWEAGETPYLDGEIRIQPFCPTTSTETRLIVTYEDIKNSPKMYDHKKYEEHMMYHNSVGRVTLYDHKLTGHDIPGFDNCYDCSTLALIARKYLCEYMQLNDITSTSTSNMIKESIQSLSKSRNLATQSSVSSCLSASKGKNFTPRSYENDKLTYLKEPHNL